ncbi:hypothetical protein [Acinetobacter sp. YH12239]|uniref:hypothetical protein n=1 Tax=Acinetobacter sp. YH12239 TaxID=2601166 RepID=UPI0015D25531|nr:hypothetical protein [Acinetobacter sp. YH12239]
MPLPSPSELTANHVTEAQFKNKLAQLINNVFDKTEGQILSSDLKALSKTLTTLSQRVTTLNTAQQQSLDASISALRQYADLLDSTQTRNLNQVIRSFNSDISTLRRYTDQLIVEKNRTLVAELLEQLMADLAASGAGENGWIAPLVQSNNGKSLQQVVDAVGSDWYNRPGGYNVGDRVCLGNGEIVKSLVPGNENDPNLNMAGWIKADFLYVESIEELRNIHFTSDSLVVSVKSYHAGLGKGGGVFWWVKDSIALEDDGIHISSATRTDGMWVRSLDQNSLVTPLMFGAKNNGEDDDRPAVSKAIAYLKKIGGGTVDFKTNKKFLFKSVPSFPTVRSMMINLDFTNIHFDFGSRFNGITCDAEVDTVFYLATGCNTLQMTSGNLSGNRKAKNIFYSDPTSYNPYLNWNGTRMVLCTEAVASLNTFMSTFNNCLAGFAPVAFEFNNSGNSKEITSVTMNSCYALDCTDRGFWIKDRAIYCTMNACAADKCRIAYAIDAQGMTMNSCGAEFCNMYFESTKYNESMSINNPLMVSIGSKDEDMPIHEIIKIQGSGVIELKNVRILSSSTGVRYRTYVLGVYKPVSAYNPQVIVDGGDIRPENTYIAAENTSFAKTVIFRRNDLRFTSDYNQQIDVSTLSSKLNEISEKNRFANLVIRLTGQEALDSSVIKSLSNANGSNSITITGSSSDRTQTVISGGMLGKINFTNCDSTIIFRNLTIESDPSVNNYEGAMFRAFNCHKVVLDNVLLKTQGAVGTAVEASNSNIYVINGTTTEGNFSATSAFKESSGGKIYYAASPTAPRARMSYGAFVPNSDIEKNNLLGWVQTYGAGGSAVTSEVYNVRRSTLEIASEVSVSANTTIYRTVAVNNCDLGDICNVAYTVAIPNGLILFAQVSVKGTVKIAICNTTAASVNLPAGVFKIHLTN